MDEKTEARVLQAQAEAELFHGAITRPSTGPATKAIVDGQLGAAVATMTGSLHEHGESLLAPTTQPAQEAPTTQAGAR